MMRVSGWNFASTRSVQIATSYTAEGVIDSSLCLHTLRADCNDTVPPLRLFISIFASTRSVQIATSVLLGSYYDASRFASTRSVQIAT